ncbi:MAG TPA: hypothetical protein VK654_03240 [Nitrospirota bacterium]|nr:hypothetical protein [Nitrospirota bacterium]
MYRSALLWLCLCLLPVQAGAAAAEKTRTAPTAAAKAEKQKQKADPADAKELSGMSIVGNDEAPKALYIVPWKASEVGMETGLNMMLNEQAAPVDRDVFMRQLHFYELSTKK